MNYGPYFNNIYTQLSLHWRRHLPQIVQYFRQEEDKRGKMPKAVKKHNKLIKYYWRSAGLWKRGDRG